MTPDLRVDHRLEHCTLPPPRRRWLGLVSACAVCGRLHALRAGGVVGTFRMMLRWEPLEPGKEMR